MQLTVAICDNKEAERLRMARLLQDYSRRRHVSFNIDLYDSGERFISAINQHRWDAVILDIFMEDADGLKAAERLRACDNECILIFVTTSLEHGVISYKFQASDYLIKPVRQDQLDETLDWYLERYHERFRTLAVRSEWDSLKIPIRDIIYIESRLHTSVIHTVKDEICTPQGISALESAVQCGDFLRCHRSYLINLRHVRRIEKQDFVMDNNDYVPIRSTSVSTARAEFMDWMFRQGSTGTELFDFL